MENYLRDWSELFLSAQSALKRVEVAATGEQWGVMFEAACELVAAARDLEYWSHCRDVDAGAMPTGEPRPPAAATPRPPGSTERCS